MTKFKFLILFFVLFLVFNAFSQPGIPSLRGFKPSDYKGSSQIWSIAQGSNGLMYFGGNDGIYIFSGQDWYKYDFDGKGFTVRCLDFDNDTLWYGSIGDFGYLLPDVKNGFKYVSLASHLDSSLSHSFSSIWSLKKSGGEVLFQGDTIIFRYDVKTRKLDTILTGNFYFLSRLDSAIAIPSFSKFYLYYPSSDTILAYTIPQKVWIYRILKYRNNIVLVFTTTGMIFFDLTTGKTVRTYSFKKDIPPLYGKTLYSFEYLSDFDAYAIGTVENGIYIIDLQGKIKYHWDKKHGLRSNTVQYLFSDRDNNLWAAHSSGITLIRTALPFRFLNESFGFEGMPYSLFQDNKNLFVGSNLGIYRWDENKFTPLKTSDDYQPQQVFTIKKFKFSDNRDFVIFTSNSGIYYIGKDNLVHLISRQFGYNLAQSPFRKDAIFFIQDYSLYEIDYKDSSFSQPRLLYTFDSHYTLADADGSHLWMVALYKKQFGYFDLKDSSAKIIVSDTNVSDVHNIDNHPVLLTDKGLFEFDYSTGNFHLLSSPLNGFLANKSVVGLEKIKSRVYGALVSYKDFTKFYLINITDKGLSIDSATFDVLHNLSDFSYFGNNIVWFIGDESYISYNMDYFCNYSPHFKPFIYEIVLNDDSLIYKAPGDIRALSLDLAYKDNTITIKYALPSFWADRGVEFSTWLEGHGRSGWSPWIGETKKEYMNLREGHYTFHLKAKNEFGQTTDEIAFAFHVRPPFYRSIVAYAIYLLLILLVIYLIIRWRLQSLVKEKERLEQLVRERTAEIQQQKEEILAQAENLKLVNQELRQKNEEINTILEQLEQANIRIQAEHKHVKDSIAYAQKIQSALIEKQNLLSEFFPDHFIFFRPKDVIGGDFYFFDKVEDYLILGLGDATGHGVPGALMSMMAYTLLSRIIAAQTVDPAKILQELKQEIINIFRSTDKNLPIYDGLDMALCTFDTAHHRLIFAGAHFPAVIIRQGELIELKGVKSFIGYSSYHKDFENREFDLQNGDKIYLFSDGFYDQFGGKDKFSKFYRKRFYQLLKEISHLDMKEQYRILARTFDEWKSDNIQTDDVTVLGVKVDFSAWDK